MNQTLHMYAFYDTYNGYTTPFPVFAGLGEHDKLAIRYFEDHLMTDSAMNLHPADFSLYHLGTYDKNSGTFVQTKEDIYEIKKGESYGNNEDTIQKRVF